MATSRLSGLAVLGVTVLLVGLQSARVPYWEWLDLRNGTTGRVGRRGRKTRSWNTWVRQALTPLS